MLSVGIINIYLVFTLRIVSCRGDYKMKIYNLKDKLEYLDEVANLE